MLLLGNVLNEPEQDGSCHDQARYRAKAVGKYFQYLRHSASTIAFKLKYSIHSVNIIKMFYDNFIELETEIKNNVSRSLAEDIGGGDLTASLIPVGESAAATVTSREDAVLCGTLWFDICFRQLSPQAEVSWLARDGDKITAGQQLCEISGPARALLTGERTALNF